MARYIQCDHAPAGERGYQQLEPKRIPAGAVQQHDRRRGALRHSTTVVQLDPSSRRTSMNSAIKSFRKHRHTVW
jgi:hypothetical protein